MSETQGRGPDLEALAKGLWGRLRDVLLVAERIGGFSFDPGEAREASAFSEEDADDIATDFVLRALRAAGDRTAWAILAAAADAGSEGVPVEDLTATLGLPRLVVLERVSDLLQLGFVARAIESERVVSNASAVELVAIVRELAGTLAERVRKARRGEGGAGDGLPLL